MTNLWRSCCDARFLTFRLEASSGGSLRLDLFDAFCLSLLVPDCNLLLLACKTKGDFPRDNDNLVRTLLANIVIG